jgi:hypothetical protein
MYQGSTFNEVLRWESTTKAYANITAISKTAPVVITAAGHGLNAGWRFKVTNVLGMKEMNSEDTYHTASTADTNTITINDINAVGYTTYTTGGTIEYYVPTNLIGYTARMQLRTKIDTVDTLLELTTENSGIIIDTTNHTITLTVSATATALLTFSSAVYSLEMIKAGVVTTLVTGTFTLEKEVTR